MRRIRPRLVMTWLYHADLTGLLAAMLSGTGAKSGSYGTSVALTSILGTMPSRPAGSFGY